MTSTCARSSPTARSASMSWVSGPPAWRMRRRTTRRPCAAWRPRPCAAGAIGFSTSRTLNHRTASGDPTPSLRARADELEAIACGVADAGHGVVELISDFWPDTDGEFELVRGMVARTGVPLSLSLAQSHRQPEAWRGLLARIEAAVAEGLPIRAQVAPRAVGVLVGLQSSYHPFLALPCLP